MGEKKVTEIKKNIGKNIEDRGICPYCNKEHKLVETGLDKLEFLCRNCGAIIKIDDERKKLPKLRYSTAKIKDGNY